MASVKLSTVQQVRLQVRPVDVYGYAAPIVGAPRWTVVPPDVALIEPDASGFFALLIALGQGTGQVHVTADTRSGDALLSIEGTLDVEVVPAQAAALLVEVAAPLENQPEPRNP